MPEPTSDPAPDPAPELTSDRATGLAPESVLERMPGRAPQVSGLHHVTFVVTQLDPAIEWFARVLGAQHVTRFDHHDETGVLFGVILELTGFAGMVELRVATAEYPLRPGYDPVTFEVADDEALAGWLRHVERVGAAHSPIKQRRTGRSLEIRTPDDTIIRLFTAPAGGFDEVPFQETHVDH
ncbi:VOC family protein [Subtercola lobariae]|uniref:VOC domain-containing protein n=1 Tax=Subtercola lobariae TaxID=1588641 RepID=A0A917B6S2_9MICO|nr:VOC family protein [Subtercola lobariae]GGF22608.1 hypothetical protein GCM10011399_15330 [Subtercola lobariae]